MRVETIEIYSREIVEANPSKLFIFGENQMQQTSRKPGGGQAVIRGLDNTFGFCTLSAIGIFWKDGQFTLNKQQIDTDIDTIKYISVNYDTLVFPKFGLGTGRANMLTDCPRTFLYMSTRLLEEFGFNNVENLVSRKF